MNALFEKMKSFSTAEEFLVYFSVDHDPALVDTGPLPILRRFHRYLRETRGLGTMDEGAQRRICRESLERAYRDFVGSAGREEKDLSSAGQAGHTTGDMQ